LSYQGDPRMQYGSENPKKIDNIVTHQIRNFRYLYHDLIMSLPNILYADESSVRSDGWMENHKLDQKMQQDMDPERRATMIRRLPKKFREKVYFQYRGKFGISGREYQEMLEASKDESSAGILKKQVAGNFDKRIAAEKDVPQMVTKAINQTVKWPSTVQTLKGPFTAGFSKTVRYLQEKRQKAKMT
jgi:translocator assembly and maintenance protein 41